ncbi:hypothetical protein [Pontibacter harenae]|uniref:hypothetical protein n=1 Tax=Pontibacter harenae TaxID=2894083 RepID=UPI001E3F0ED9|nr:hypothetical protein [Pontibacter harenae]MCC9168635.1 hypothetical protein [Pontibacter harenae]
MISQEMFAQEQRIRDVLGRQRSAVLYEQERYRAYLYNPSAKAKTQEAWKERISANTEASNLLAEYLADYTVGQHGVLKYLRRAEEEAKTAKQTLLYLDRIHEERTKRKAAELAEQIAYRLMGDQVDLLEPQLQASWLEAVNGELAVYEQMVRERRERHG